MQISCTLAYLLPQMLDLVLLGVLAYSGRAWASPEYMRYRKRFYMCIYIIYNYNNYVCGVIISVRRELNFECVR